MRQRPLSLRPSLLQVGIFSLIFVFLLVFGSYSIFQTYSDELDGVVDRVPAIAEVCASFASAHLRHTYPRRFGGGAGRGGASRRGWICGPSRMRPPPPAPGTHQGPTQDRSRSGFCFLVSVWLSGSCPSRLRKGQSRVVPQGSWSGRLVGSLNTRAHLPLGGSRARSLCGGV